MMQKIAHFGKNMTRYYQKYPQVNKTLFSSCNLRYFGSAFDHMDDMKFDTNMEANLSVTDTCLEVSLLSKTPN